VQEVHDRVALVARRVADRQIDPQPQPSLHGRRPDRALDAHPFAPRLRDTDVDARDEADEQQGADDFRHLSTVPIFLIA